MKPYTLCHMVTTIDGKILTNRWGRLPGPKQGASLFETTAATFGIGAWIVGTKTMTEFCEKPFKLPPAPRGIERDDHVAQPAAKKLAIGVDARGQTHWKKSEVEGDHVVLLLSQRVSNAYIAHLQAAGASYFFCGKTEVELPVAIDKITQAFKLKKLMAQGGGKFNGSMLAAGLIDEISQIVIPVVDGGVGVSSLFDIEGHPSKAAAHLKPVSHKALPGGVRWVRYRVVKPGRRAI